MVASDEPENTLLADDSSDDLENVKTAVRDEEEVKLKETIHFIVSKKCEQESSQFDPAKTSDRKFSREFTYCLADLVYKYAERVARDVEAFSRHAGRKSVRPDDVLLAVRNNDDAVDALAAVMASKGITLPGTKKGKGRKRQ
eukprot:1249748-Amorphochlora_amoeboformis.AAC.1